MKKILVAVLMAGLVTFAGASIARAQVGDSLLVKVPFPFIVSGKVLPAGSYRITAQSGDPSLLLITSIDGHSAAFADTQKEGGEVPDGARLHLSFKNFDGHYFLSQVVFGDALRDVRLSKVMAEQTLVRLNLMPGEHAEGSAK